MRHPTRVLILGTGGNSIDILDTLQDVNALAAHPVYECRGFLDDNAALWGTRIHGVPVLGPLASAPEQPECALVNGIGAPSNFWQKEAILAKTGAPLERFLTLLHPSASVSRTATLGRGVVVFQHVVITSNVKIGHHVILLPNTVISHDDVIGDYTCIAGGVCVSGQVTIGRSCYLGTNSSVIGNVAIGDRCLIGMGSCVLRSLPPNSVVVGNPARLLRKTVEGPDVVRME
jgi:sugar O-acyltransferase (sialic acid O-acetyltransferase NeuD family)